MHIYFLQHASHFGPARLADWLTSMGHSFNVCRLYADEVPPRPGDFDALIVLGGPEQIVAHGWTKREQHLLERTLKSSKPIMGLGYGAELIAEALGAIVSLNTHGEFGWHAVRGNEDGDLDLPERFDAFLWHRRIFGLPEGAISIGASDASPLQGFTWDGARVVAMHCHLEATHDWVQRLAEKEAGSLENSGPWVQSRDEMLNDSHRFARQAAVLDRVMIDWLRL
ncbi:type 1 glutamine amidotransferase [Kushneria konosiri]|uniref:Glutamine amidotransferase n=1 Tax=Kushneria konosiri TaxID=698828 RepID=A0A2Z2HKY2_9GAMM|nr:type 1 glutamine amidotransferase [Kushneria konosiri]ARS54401.1 glutamine amidotransferase [Kushneria konosiri]